MSDELLHISHGRALSTVLAVPAVSFIEENEVSVFRFSDCFSDSKDTLHRGAFPAHGVGIFFVDPYPSLSHLLSLAGALLSPHFDRHCNSF